MTPHTVEHPYLQFIGNTGYSRHGDTVSLFVDRIDNLGVDGTTSGNLVLQLWACESPYAGGDLTGWKLAEDSLGILQPGNSLAPVKADVPASFPESGDFAMTLVIAEWDGEGFNRIHDFRCYPERDVFLHPCLEGQLGYRIIDEEHLVLDIERIRNPRAPDNISGTLSLELWVLDEPYSAGAFQGHALGGMTLGTLAGTAAWEHRSYDVVIAPPPDGTYVLVLMLREWNGNAYVTRDHCNFNHRVSFPLTASVAPTGETLATGEPDQTASPPDSSETVGAEPAASAVNSTPETARPSSPLPPAAAGSAGSEPAKRQGRALRLWQWIKQHW